jgi:hypothetical protein
MGELAMSEKLKEQNLEKLLEMLSPLVATKPHPPTPVWVSVEERLPEQREDSIWYFENIHCLVLYPSGQLQPTVMTFRLRKKDWLYKGIKLSGRVTH